MIPQSLLDRERDFARAFARAALDGAPIDGDHVREKIAEHTRDQEAARQRVEEASGGAITNPKSAPQVAPYLAATGRYDLPLSEKTGKPGAAKGVLEPYAYLGDGLARDILEYRRHDTALGLLLTPLRVLSEQGDGRCRTSILTMQANTGRTSSRNMNLQQFSRQGGMRACLTTDRPGETVGISADFSSVEIRVAAALSGDESMKHLIAMGDAHPDMKKEFDFHWRTAITCYGPEATKENRYNSKRINFAKMYGSGKKSAASQVGIPVKEVSRAFDAFSEIAPGYEAWDKQMREFVSSGGRAYMTYSGRPVWLTGKGEHAAGNAAIQGTARELLVDAVLKWEQGPWKDSIIVPVHDELIIWDIPAGEAEAALAFLIECMQTTLVWDGSRIISTGTLCDGGVQIKAEPSEPWTSWPDAS